MWPPTRRLLRRIGVRPGMTCLDVGCGIGAVTRQLARMVGPDGHAVGIDRDERCVELARAVAARHQLPAAFRVASVADLGDEGLYDLVYSRFLLTHLPHPAEVLQRLVRAARPGGRVVVEDIEFAAHICYPACPAFDRYLAIYRELVQRKGGDADIGPRLVQLLLDAGLEGVAVEVVQPTFREGAGKWMAAVTMEHIGEAAVEAGLALPGDVDTLIAELDRLARDPRTILSVPRIFQVWGRRRAAERGYPAVRP
jgi:SAM-dependent methyltransferase